MVNGRKDWKSCIHWDNFFNVSFSIQPNLLTHKSDKILRMLFYHLCLLKLRIYSLIHPVLIQYLC